MRREIVPAFAPGRVNPKREFFRIDPEQAIAILRLLQKEDATTEVEQQPETIDATSIEAGKELRTYFPHITTAISLNFLSFDHMSG